MTVFEGFEEIVQEDYPLGEMTTFGVGGRCAYLLRPRTEDELHQVLERCDAKGLDVRAIGRGSNILVRDEGVSGAVVQLDAKGFGQVAITEDLLRAGAATDVRAAPRHKTGFLARVFGIETVAETADAISRAEKTTVAAPTKPPKRKKKKIRRRRR